MLPLLVFLLFIAVFYTAILRPQQQRARQHQATVAALEVGDRVITAGGIHAVIVEVAEETVRIEVAPGTILTLARPAISRRVDDSAPADRTEPTDPVPETDPSNDGSTL